MERVERNAASYSLWPASRIAAHRNAVVHHRTSTDAARRLAEKGLFLSHGDFYAATVVKRLGLEPEGLIRAGCACYTTDEEIDRLIEAVNDLCTSSSC